MYLGSCLTIELGRVLRDAPQLICADVGTRHSLLGAAGQPSRRDRDPARRRRLQDERAGPGSGDRGGTARPARPRPRRQHARRLHHRSRHRLPGGEGDPVRSRHRGDDDRARPERVHGREGDRRSGQPPRCLPDPLRARRGRCTAVAAGRLSDTAGSRRGRAAARGDLHRDDLPRRLPAPPRDPHRALEVHQALRRLRAPGAGQLR